MKFLPPGTLSDSVVPIHIPLNRYDGRTKDYMVSCQDQSGADTQYIEVASGEAARKVLQKCQNAFMPGGPLTQPRARAVTITQVPHSELIKEVSFQSLKSFPEADDVSSDQNQPASFKPSSLSVKHPYKPLRL